MTIFFKRSKIHVSMFKFSDIINPLKCEFITTFTINKFISIVSLENNKVLTKTNQFPYITLKESSNFIYSLIIYSQ